MSQDASNLVSAFTLVVGIVLWLLGGRLLRVGACLMGLAIGVIISTIFIAPGDAAIAAVSIVLAAIIGLALGWVLFRLWMGLSLAIVLALAVPMALLAFQGIEPPNTLGPSRESSPNLPHVTQVNMQTAPMTTEQQGEGLERTTAGRLSPVLASTSDWWNSLAPETRLEAERNALFAGVLGLVFGLIAPLTAAALQSAILGACLILSSVMALAPTFAPSFSPLLPHESKSFFAIMLMIAMTGFIFQWSSAGPKADKEAKAQTADQHA